jgi:hypothetical protein
MSNIINVPDKYGRNIEIPANSNAYLEVCNYARGAYTRLFINDKPHGYWECLLLPGNYTTWDDDRKLIGNENSIISNVHYYRMKSSKRTIYFYLKTR